MAVPAFPDIAPSRGSRLGARVRILRKSLGDGYEQVAADGLNHIVRTYELVLEARTIAEIDRVAAFLKARGGVEPFDFRPPELAADVRWRCERWTGPEWTSAALRSLRATFVEDFTPG